MKEEPKDKMMEEYKTIRKEMLERFQKLHYLTIGTVGFICWLFFSDRFFLAKDLGLLSKINVLVLITALAAYLSLQLLKDICHQGGYLAIFYELNKEHRWHLRSRLIKAKWKNDGPRCAIIYACTAIVSTLVLLLYNRNLNIAEIRRLCGGFMHAGLGSAVLIILSVFFARVFYRLWSLQKWVRNDFAEWYKYYQDYGANRQKEDKMFIDELDDMLKALPR